MRRLGIEPLIYIILVGQVKKALANSVYSKHKKLSRSRNNYCIKHHHTSFNIFHFWGFGVVGRRPDDSHGVFSDHLGAVIEFVGVRDDHLNCQVSLRDNLFEDFLELLVVDLIRGSFDFD